MKRISMLLTKPSKRALGNDDADSPEQRALKGVRLFCESGTPSNSMQRGEEVTILPSIVEAAESSPQAAAAAAHQLRKFLSKDHYAYPSRQYNAVMLIRILSDNPGKGFTKYIDEKFKETIKWLLNMSRDPSVQQIMRETLDSFEREKADDENLQPLLRMWEKVKKTQPKMQYGGASPGSYTGRGLYQTNWEQQRQQQYHSNGRPRHALPNPEELAARIEEARTSAKLLIQLVQTTPPDEVINHDLIKEFAERCQSAQRSLHGYMDCQDPAPDEPTFQTLIETNEQLSLASSKHQRALLAARRHHSQTNAAIQNAEQLSSGNGTSAQPQQQQQQRQPYSSPQLPQQSLNTPSSFPQHSLPTRQHLHPASANASPPAQNDPFSDSNQVPAQGSDRPSSNQYNYPPPPMGAGQSSQRSFNHPSPVAATGGQTQNRYSSQPASGPQYSQLQQNRDRFSTTAQPYRPIPTGPAELSGVATPPQEHEDFHSRQTDDGARLPPPPSGPPPNRGQIPSVQIPDSSNEHDDLYNTSPMASRSGPVSAVSSTDHRPASSGLYSVESDTNRLSNDSPPLSQQTPLSAQALRSLDDSHQDRTGSNTINSPNALARKPVGSSWGEAETPTTERFRQNGTLNARRVKDDEPMTPALGVSGAGWQY